MRSLTTLLQQADPLHHETPLGDHQLQLLRLRVRARTQVNAPAHGRSRRSMLVATSAAAAVVATLGYGLWARVGSPVLAAVRFEARLAETSPAAGLVVATVPDGGLIYLHPETLAGNDDVAQSWVVENGPADYAVAIELVSSSAERMRQETAGHVGRPLALLIDGRVVAAPVVRSPMGQSAVLTGYPTRADAERVAEGIQR